MVFIGPRPPMSTTATDLLLLTFRTPDIGVLVPAANGTLSFTEERQENIVDMRFLLPVGGGSFPRPSVELY